MSKLQDPFDRAHRLHQSGRIQEAIDLYLKILRKQPRNGQLLFVLGTAYLQTGQFKKSIEPLQRSALINPKNAAAHCNLGMSLNALRRMEEALSSFGRALLIKPDYAEAYNNRGKCDVNEVPMDRCFSATEADEGRPLDVGRQRQASNQAVRLGLKRFWS